MMSFDEETFFQCSWICLFFFFNDQCLLYLPYGILFLGRISSRTSERTKILRFCSAWAFLGFQNTNRPASWFPHYQQRSQLFLICYQSPTICSQSYAFQLLNVGAFICFACYLCVCVSTRAHILLLSPWWVSGGEAINTSSNLCV